MSKQITQQEKEKIIKIFFKCFNMKKMYKDKMVNSTPTTISKILKETKEYQLYLKGLEILEYNAIEEYKKGKTFQYIQKKYKINIRKNISKLNIKKRTNSDYRKKFEVNDNFFDIIDTEKKAYWLGFIYADGYITKNILGISVSSWDEEILENFKKDINYNGEIKQYKSTSGYSKITLYSRLHIRSDKLVYFLIKHGVKYQKTNILTFPNENIVHKDLLHHFIRGYIDGDGCITFSNVKGKPKYKIKIMGTDSMLNGIKNFLTPNKELKIYKKNKNDIVGCLEYGGNKQVTNLLNIIYKDANRFLLRKFLKYKSLITI